MASLRIKPDWEVFQKDGEKAVGAVLNVSPQSVTIYIENHGEIDLDPEHIERSEDGKVLLASSDLPDQLTQALAHARDSEAGE